MTVRARFGIESKNSATASRYIREAVLRSELSDQEDLADAVARLARRFKVSTLVILRRIRDAGVISGKTFWDGYNAEATRLLTLSLRAGSGGNYYLTQAVRVSKRFARALVVSTLEGQTLHRDAFRLLGMSKLATFQKLGASLGVT